MSEANVYVAKPRKIVAMQVPMREQRKSFDDIEAELLPVAAWVWEYHGDVKIDRDDNGFPHIYLFLRSKNYRKIHPGQWIIYEDDGAMFVMDHVHFIKKYEKETD